MQYYFTLRTPPVGWSNASRRNYGMSFTMQWRKVLYTFRRKQCLKDLLTSACVSTASKSTP